MCIKPAAPGGALSALSLHPPVPGTPVPGTPVPESYTGGGADGGGGG
jgi:hypothetical protein